METMKKMMIIHEPKEGEGALPPPLIFFLKATPPRGMKYAS